MKSKCRKRRVMRAFTRRAGIVAAIMMAALVLGACGGTAAMPEDEGSQAASLGAGLEEIDTGSQGASIGEEAEDVQGEAWAKAGSAPQDSLDGEEAESARSEALTHTDSVESGAPIGEEAEAVQDEALTHTETTEDGSLYDEEAETVSREALTHTEDAPTASPSTADGGALARLSGDGVTPTSLPTPTAIAAASGGAPTTAPTATPMPPTAKPSSPTPIPPTARPSTPTPAPPTRRPDTPPPAPPTRRPDTPTPVPPTRKPSTPTPIPPTKKPATPTPTPHQHQWVAVTKTVHHDEVGHWGDWTSIGAVSVEPFETHSHEETNAGCPYPDTETDLYLPITEIRQICGCGYIFPSGYGEAMKVMTDHMDEDIAKEGTGHGYYSGTVVVGYEHWRTPWIVDAPAYDEEILTGHVCSGCGATKAG